MLRPFPRGPPQQAAPYDVSIKKKKSGNGSKQKLETSGPALSYLKNSPMPNSTSRTRVFQIIVFSGPSPDLQKQTLQVEPRNLILASSLCDSHAHQSVEPMGDATFMEGLGKV